MADKPFDFSGVKITSGLGVAKPKTVKPPIVKKAVGVASFWKSPEFLAFVKSSGAQTVETPTGTAFGFGIKPSFTKHKKEVDIRELVNEANSILPKTETGKFPQLSQDLRYGDTLYQDEITNEITGNPKDIKKAKQLYWNPDAYEPSRLVWGITPTGKPVVLDEKTSAKLKDYYSTFINVDPNLVDQQKLIEERKVTGLLPKQLLDSYYASKGNTLPGVRYYFDPLVLEEIQIAAAEGRLDEDYVKGLFERAHPFSTSEPNLLYKIGETGDMMKEIALAGESRGNIISKTVGDLLHALTFLTGRAGTLTSMIAPAEIKKLVFKFRDKVKDPNFLEENFNWSNLTIEKRKELTNFFDTWTYIAISGTEEERKGLLDFLGAFENKENLDQLGVDLGGIAISIFGSREKREQYYKEHGISYKDEFGNLISPINESDITKGLVKQWGLDLSLITNPSKVAEQYMYVAEQATLEHMRAYKLSDMGGIENQKLAIQTLVDSYKWEFARLPRDPAASWEFFDVGRRDYFFTIMAQLELQARAPLNRNELRQLSSTIGDPVNEFLGQYLVDLNNLTDLPMGRILTGLVGGEGSFAYKALGFNTISNMRNATLASLTTNVVWNKVIKPTAGMVGEALADTPMGKLALNTLHVDNWFKLSVKSHARILANNAENIFKAISPNPNMVIDLETLLASTNRLTKYSIFISELKVAGKSADDILDLVKTAMVNAGDSTLATDKVVNALSDMVNTVDPLKSNWSGIIAKQFDTVRHNAMSAEIINQQANPTIQKILREFERAVINGGGDTEKKLLADFQREIIEHARVIAESKVTPTVVSRMFGNVFDGAFIDANKAWDNTNILRGSFSAWLGTLLPVTKYRMVEGTKIAVTEGTLKGFVRGWNDTIYKTYRGFMENVINKWLYMTGRFPAYQQMENAVSYVVMHGTGNVPDRMMDILTFDKRMANPAMTVADNIAEVRFMGYGLDGSNKVIDEIAREVELKNKAFGWVASPVSIGSNFIDSFRHARARIMADMIEVGMKVDPTDMSADELLHLTTETTRKLPWAFRTAWVESIKDQTNFMETTYRSAMAGKLIDENMSILDSAAMTANLNKLRGNLIAKGLAQENIDSLMELAELSWKRAYGNPDVFEKLMDVKGMLNGTNLNSAWIPEELLTGANPEDMLAYRKIEAEWDNYVRTLGAEGKTPTLDNIKTFFKEVSQRVDDAAQEAQNSQGIIAKSLLVADDGSKPISASLASLLDSYKQAGGDITKMAGYTTKEAKREIATIITDNREIFHQLKINTKGKSYGDILSELSGVTGGTQKVANIATTPWSKLVRDLSEHFNDYPQDLISANKWALREKISQTVKSGVKIKPKDFANMPIEKQIDYVQMLAKGEGEELTVDLARKTIIDINNKLGLTDYAKNKEYLEFENSAIRKLSVDKTLSAEHRGRIDEVLADIRGVDSNKSQFTSGIYPGVELERTNAVVDRKLYKIQYEPAWQLHSAHETQYLRAQGDYLESVRLAIANGTSIPNVTRSQMWEWYGFTNYEISPTGNVIGVDLVDKDTGLTAHAIGQVKLKDGSLVDSPVLSEFKKLSGFVDAADLEKPLLRPFQEIVEEAPPFAKTATEVTVTSKLPTGYPKATSIKITPQAGETMEQAIARERKSFITAIIDHEEWGDILGDKTPRYYIDKILNPSLKATGQKLDDLAPEDIVGELNKLAMKRTKEGSTEIAKSIKTLSDKISYDLAQFDAMAITGKNIPTPIVMARLPDDLRGWVSYRMEHLAEFETFKDNLKTWQAFIEGKLNDQSLMKVLKLDLTDSTKVSSAVGETAQGMAKLRDTTWYGGELEGLSVEGAVHKMNIIMKNYTSSATNFDEFMKTSFPFWMFPRSAALAWTKMLAENPIMLSLYNKYLRYSYSTVTANGYVDSKGQPLSSYAGKVPIGKINGRNIWFEALPGLPIRYLYNINSAKSNQDERETIPIAEQVMNFIVRDGEAKGLRMGALMDLATSFFIGSKDRFTGADVATSALSDIWEYVLPIPKELIPPFMSNAMTSAFKKIGLSPVGEAIAPQVTWFDSIVETKMLTRLLADIRAHPGDEIYAYEQTKNVQDILKNPKREGIPEWDKFVTEAKNDDFYNKNLIGFVSGFYPRYMSEDDLNLYALRSKLNYLRDSINSEVGTVLFAIYPNEAKRKQLFNDERYHTPEGYVWGLRQNTQYVKDEYTGEIITDQEERRDRMGQLYSEDIQSEEYYSALDSLAQVRDAKLKVIPIGDSASQYDTYVWWSDERTKIEQSYPNAQRAWSKGYKSDMTVYAHYQSLWWQAIRETKPKWDREHGELYDEYKANVDKWVKETMPIIGDAMATTFMLNVQGGGEDSIKITNQLLAETNNKGWEMYQINSDDIYEALLRSWEETYLDPYYAEMEGKESFIYQQMKRQWLDTHPAPTPVKLYDYVVKIYGKDKWTKDEIYAAMTDPKNLQRDILTVPERQLTGKDERERQADEMKEWYAWQKVKESLSVDKKAPTFYNTFRSLGGKENSLNLLFGTVSPYSFSNVAEFDELYKKMTATKEKLIIAPPADEGVAILADAQRENELLGQLLTKQFGENWKTTFLSYEQQPNKAYKKTWANEHPTEFAQYLEYQKIRKQFGAEHPQWETYYGGKKYARSIGASSEGSTPLVRTNYGGGTVPKATVTSQKLFGAPLRSGSDLASLGFSGGFSKVAGEWLLNEISIAAGSSRKLSKAALTRLRNMQNIYPNLSREIGAIIAKYS